MSSSPIEEAHVYFLQSFKKNEIRKIISSESIDKRPLDVKLNQKYRFYIYDLNEVKDMYKITSRINIADDDKFKTLIIGIEREFEVFVFFDFFARSKLKKLPEINIEKIIKAFSSKEIQIQSNISEKRDVVEKTVIFHKSILKEALNARDNIDIDKLFQEGIMFDSNFTDKIFIKNLSYFYDDYIIKNPKNNLLFSGNEGFYCLSSKKYHSQDYDYIFSLRDDRLNFFSENENKKLNFIFYLKDIKKFIQFDFEEIINNLELYEYNFFENNTDYLIYSFKIKHSEKNIYFYNSKNNVYESIEFTFLN